MSQEQLPSALSSDFLRKRGNCCKSNCLHCPYGTTLRVIGVEITPYSDTSATVIDSLIAELVNSSQVVDSFLSEAFGSEKKYPKEQAYLLTLKEVHCGLCYIENNKIQSLYLREDFSNQGITKDYLQEKL